MEIRSDSFRLCQRAELVFRFRHPSPPYPLPFPSKKSFARCSLVLVVLRVPPAQRVGTSNENQRHRVSEHGKSCFSTRFIVFRCTTIHVPEHDTNVLQNQVPCLGTR